jgi:uncharacterized coiled-coil DUF342 family protein
MEPFGFDKLPEVVRQIFEKVGRIEKMLQDFQPKDDDDQLLNVEEAADFVKTSTAALYTKVIRTTDQAAAAHAYLKKLKRPPLAGSLYYD